MQICFYKNQKNTLSKDFYIYGHKPMRRLLHIFFEHQKVYRLPNWIIFEIWIFSFRKESVSYTHLTLPTT